jgi:hypothetical protein
MRAATSKSLKYLSTWRSENKIAQIYFHSSHVPVLNSLTIWKEQEMLGESLPPIN